MKTLGRSIVCILIGVLASCATTLPLLDLSTSSDSGYVTIQGSYSAGVIGTTSLVIKEVDDISVVGNGGGYKEIRVSPGTHTFDVAMAHSSGFSNTIYRSSVELKFNVESRKSYMPNVEVMEMAVAHSPPKLKVWFEEKGTGIVVTPVKYYGKDR